MAWTPIGAQEIQKVLNAQGRRVTGCFRTTPQVALMHDTGLGPALPYLNNRVQRYKLRQMMMPDAKGGGRESQSKRNDLQRMEGIDELIPEEFDDKRLYASTTLPTTRISLEGKVIIQEHEQPLEEARLARQGLVSWNDGSSKEDEWVR